MLNTEPNTLIYARQDLVGTDMHGDYVVLDIERGEYYGLTQVARHLWELVQEGPKTTSQLIDLTASHYRIEPADCEGDVTEFLADLITRNLVQCK